jgi:hypothetical protein
MADNPILSEEFQRECINEYFRIARSKIEYRLGIKLQLGELFELRKDIEFVDAIDSQDRKKIRDKGLIPGDKHSICPDDEAAIMFMNRNYGTQLKDLLHNNVKKYYNERDEAFHLAGYDYYKEYFKRVQEEMHFP